MHYLKRLIPLGLILTSVWLVACGGERAAPSVAPSPTAAALASPTAMPAPAANLTGATWLWQRLEQVDGTTLTPFHSPTFMPWLRFDNRLSPNESETGFVYTGNMGCNSLSGTYLPGEAGELQFGLVARTSMLCDEARMASEDVWLASVETIQHYAINDDTLLLTTASGDVLVFVAEGVVSAESQLYAAIINEWDGGDAPYLIVREPAFNRPGVSVAETREQVRELFPARAGEPGISAELLDAFFAAQTDAAPHDFTFPDGSEPPFIAQSELDALFADGYEAGWQALDARYPGVTTVYTVSPVAVAGDSALVYYAIRTRDFHGGYYSWRVDSDGAWLGNVTSILWSAADLPQMPTDDPLSQAVDIILNGLTIHQRDGYPLASRFFHGVYGVYTESADPTHFSPLELTARYAADIYQERTLNLSADKAGELPGGISAETAAALNPFDLPITAIVPSGGWGVDGSGKAILYFTEEDGAVRWLGAIFSFDDFASPVEVAPVAPPDEVIAFLEDEARREQILNALQDEWGTSAWMTLNPDATLALLAERDETRAVTGLGLIDVATGAERDLPAVGQAWATSQAIWRDASGVLVGYHDDAGDEGPNWGHLALVDVLSQEVVLIEPDRLLSQPPAIMADGTIVYYTVDDIVAWHEDGVQRWPQIELASLSPGSKRWVRATAFSADYRYLIAVMTSGEPDSAGFYSTSYMLFDLMNGRVQDVFRQIPPPMGGYFEPALWNESGSWAAISPWTSQAEEDGVTLVQAETGDTVFLGIGTRNPRWAGPQTVVYDSLVSNVSQTHLIDLATGERSRIALRFLSVAEQRAISWAGETYTAASAESLPQPDPADLWSTHVFTSTDGAWTATAHSYQPLPPEDEASGSQHRQTFTVTSSDQAKSWRAIDALENWGIGVGHYEPLLWTDEMLYFTYRPIPGGCGHANGSDLWSLDLTSGQVTRLAPDQPRYGIRVALSPQADRFAYNSENGFTIRHLTDNTLTEYALPIAMPDLFALGWSPDGDQLLLVNNITEGCQAEWEQQVIIVSLDTSLVRDIVTVTLPAIWRVDWVAESMVELRYGPDARTSFLDLKSGKLAGQ